MPCNLILSLTTAICVAEPASSDATLLSTFSASDIYTESSILTSFIWEGNQRGTLNVYPPAGTASSSSSGTFSVPTTTSSDGSRDFPGSTTDTGSSSAGSYTGVSGTDGSGKSPTIASTRTSGGVLSTAQTDRHSSFPPSNSSGSLSANIMSAPSSRPSTILRPTSATASETTDELTAATSDSNPIINTATRSVVNVIPTTILISDILPSSTLNRPNGYTGDSTSTSTSSPENPTITDNGFLPSTSVSQNEGISSGAVAAISTIGAAILAVLLLFLIRRYRRVRRKWRLTHIHHRARAGWSTTFSSGGGSDHVSSTVTSYVNRTPVSFADPVPPPMAEIRDDHLTRNPSKPRYSLHPPRPLDIKISSHSDSRSAHANAVTSNLDSSCLVIPDGLAQLQPEIATPMSVRPFTPSESFKFPKPPSNGEWIQIPDRDSHGTALSSSTEMYPPSPTNPFSEPESPITPELSPDRIRVLEVFDDGWAMIEKIPEGNGKGKEVVLEPGLIPIDCLRMTGDSLPPFLA
ncbi:hypothetical protein EDD18DRAFT_1101849 [Armillaria luteobubalina]|uniref:SH3 domain-containing protein n=1 Tax=Armillaria luteobubalina TaxID=153913 RepID=A0AA39US93_9AGAR|nr:hypothetical protein EDD18DRAFT_1101849 [Armillaria luteobubalina]